MINWGRISGKMSKSLKIGKSEIEIGKTKIEKWNVWKKSVMDLQQIGTIEERIIWLKERKLESISMEAFSLKKKKKNKWLVWHYQVV